MKKYLFLSFFAGMMILFSACSMFRGDRPGIKTDPETGETYDLNVPPKYLLTIHQTVEYPRGEEDEMTLDNPAGRHGKLIWVKKKSLFHSSVVMEITPLPTIRSNYYALRLKLSPRGEKWWNNMVDEHYQEKLAIAVDGRFLGTFIATELSETDSSTVKKEGDTITRVQGNPDQKYVTATETVMDVPGWVMMPGPYHESLTKGICDNAKRNYFYYIEEIKKAQRIAAGEPKKGDIPEEDEFPKAEDEDEKFIKEMHKSQDVFNIKQILDL